MPRFLTATALVACLLSSTLAAAEPTKLWPDGKGAKAWAGRIVEVGTDSVARRRESASLRIDAQNNGNGKENWPGVSRTFDATNDWSDFTVLTYCVQVRSSDPSVTSKDISFVVYQRGSTKQQYVRHRVPVSRWVTLRDDLRKYNRSDVERVVICMYETQTALSDRYTWFISEIKARPASRFDGTWPSDLAMKEVTVDEAAPTLATSDGLTLHVGRSHVVEMDGRVLGTRCAGPTGFFVRDVAADSELEPFVGKVVRLDARKLTQSAESAAAQIALTASYAAERNCIRVTGEVLDLTGGDRAITLYYALPAEPDGLTWWDDVRTARRVEGDEEFGFFRRRGVGANGRQSSYPWSALCTRAVGLSLAYPLDAPRFWRVAYSPALRLYFLAFDFGLSKETAKFPSKAAFDFVMYRFDAQWGLRAAAQKYYELFPQFFVKRVPDEGIWMPFTDIARVKNPLDFGFMFQEGAPNVKYDDSIGVLSFRYTEPYTYWMPMPKGDERTYEGILKRLELTCDSKHPFHRNAARSVKTCGCLREDGKYDVSHRDTPWCVGGFFRLNADPELPEPPRNRAHLNYTPELGDKMFGAVPVPGSLQGQDGEYLDSLEGYGGLSTINFRREHFKYADYPLLYSLGSRQVGILEFFSTYEFTKYISDDVHRRGKLMFENASLLFVPWCTALMDVLGTEVGWLRGDRYVPNDDATMNYRRTLCYQKPYLLLMNVNFTKFDKNMVESYFKRSLFYGMHPSLFCGDFKQDGEWKRSRYWQTSDLVERDRELYLRYIPTIRTVAKAGWQPITHARVGAEPGQPPRVWVERYGTWDPGAVYFTLLNTGQRLITAQLAIDLAAIGIKANEKLEAMEAVGGASLRSTRKGQRLDVAVALSSEDVAVVRLCPSAAVEQFALAQARSIVDRAVLSPVASRQKLSAEQGAAIAKLAGLKDGPAQFPDAKALLGAGTAARDVALAKLEFERARFLAAGARLSLSVTGEPAQGGQCTALVTLRPEGVMPRPEFGLTAPAGWRVEREARGRASCEFAVHVPAAAKTGQWATITASVRGLNKDGQALRTSVWRSVRVAERMAASLDVEGDHASRQRVLKLRATNLSAGPFRGRLTLNLPPGWKVSPPADRLEVGPLAESVLTFQAEIPADAPAKMYEVSAVVRDEVRELARPSAFAIYFPRTSSGGNLALASLGTSVAVDSCYSTYTAKPLIDGVVRTNGLHWTDAAWASADAGEPHWIELTFPRPERVGKVVLYWSIDNGKAFPSRAYKVQWLDGSGWKDAASVVNNPPRVLTVHAFQPVKTRKLRVWQPVAGGPASRPHIMWVSEIEAFAR